MTATPLRERLERADTFTGPQPVAMRTIRATPFAWRPVADIPRRPWVYGRWLLRHTITAVVAPGGVGKSSLMASTILALATGRALLGKTVWDGPKRVWYWNLEDDGDELSRQVQAAARHHCIGEADCGDRLFVDSGLDGATLCTAIEGPNGAEILRPVIDALVEELIARGIDVLIVDPFVSSHAISENDNGAIDAVAKEWARVAKRASCSIVLVHHTKKLGGGRVTAEASRGAIALIAAARSTLVLNRMEPDEATKLGVVEDEERRRIFSVQDDKANRAPPEKAEWYRIASVDLGNGEAMEAGDNVGVVGCWEPADMFEGITTDDLHRVQLRIAEGEWRHDVQASAWVGKAVADVLGLSADAANKADRAKLNAVLRTWIANGALRRVEGKDEKSRSRSYVEVGEWAIADGRSPPRKSKVEIGGETSAVECLHPTTPINRGGGGEETATRAQEVEKGGAGPLDLGRTRF